MEATDQPALLQSHREGTRQTQQPARWLTWPGRAEGGRDHDRPVQDPRTSGQARPNLVAFQGKRRQKHRAQSQPRTVTRGHTHCRSGPDPRPLTPDPVPWPRHKLEKALLPAPAAKGPRQRPVSTGRVWGALRRHSRLLGWGYLPVPRTPPATDPAAGQDCPGGPTGPFSDEQEAETEGPHARSLLREAATHLPGRLPSRPHCCPSSLCGGGSGGFQNFPGSTGCVEASGGGGPPREDPGKCWHPLCLWRDPRIHIWGSRDTSSLGDLSKELAAGTAGLGAVASVTHVVAPAPGRSHRPASAWPEATGQGFILSPL